MGEGRPPKENENHSPSLMVPRRPRTSPTAGLTRNIVDVPVMPNTAHSNAISAYHLGVLRGGIGLGDRNRPRRVGLELLGLELLGLAESPNHRRRRERAASSCRKPMPRRRTTMEGEGGPPRDDDDSRDDGGGGRHPPPLRLAPSAPPLSEQW